jgi:hypothetical protein
MDLSSAQRAIRLDVLSRVYVVSVPADVLADISDPASKVLIEVDEGNFETLCQTSTDRALAGSARADQSNLIGAAHVTSNDIPPQKSFAFIGSDSARDGGVHFDVDAEALSITRLEGSRWRGGRLWSWKWDPRAWAAVDRGAVGARAATARTRLVARTDRTREVTGWHAG